MRLIIGQKVAYPNQGVCLVEEFKQYTIGGKPMSGYSLRVLNDNSTIFVPEENAGSVGIRPLISSSQCKKLIDKLSEDFEPVSCDWKTRSREFTERLRTGDVFEAAEVLKMLTFLSHEKKLSFREQSLLEKSKFLILSEITNAYSKEGPPIEDEIICLVEAACSKHIFTQPRVMVAAGEH
jgi:CarD family transcriptional regulator